MANGIVVSFDERNGFGFIRSRAFSQDVFVHARAVSGGKLLKAGERVKFDAEPSDNGPRAVRVEPRRSRLRLVNRVTPEALTALLLGATLLPLTLLARYAAGWAWWWAWLLAVNAVTLLAFAIDKHRAIVGRRRISESLLLGLALAGGTPAGFLAMSSLRHKTQKGPFRLAMGLIALVQCAGLVALWWSTRRPGA
jgi:uncharacterized membrane protein YsdA (DUF1294 family)/cold shock CspA family protein